MCLLVWVLGVFFGGGVLFDFGAVEVFLLCFGGLLWFFCLGWFGFFGVFVVCRCFIFILK